MKVLARGTLEDLGLAPSRMAVGCILSGTPGLRGLILKDWGIQRHASRIILRLMVHCSRLTLLFMTKHINSESTSRLSMCRALLSAWSFASVSSSTPISASTSDDVICGRLPATVDSPVCCCLRATVDDVYLVSLRLQAELFWSVFDPLHGLWGAQCQERSSQRGLCSYTVHWQESERRVWQLGSCGHGTDFLSGF